MLATATASVQIITCDPTTRRVEGQLKDGALIQIVIWDLPSLFVWPQVGDWWTVTRARGPWMLGTKVESKEGHSVESLEPGEGKIDADVVVDSEGRTFIAVDLSDFSDGDSLVYDAALSRFVPGP